MKRLLKQSYKYIIILAASLLAALVLELTCFMREARYTFSEEPVSLLHNDAYTVTPYGYNEEDDLYTPFLNDPQLTFSNIDAPTTTLCILFYEENYSSSLIEIFYKKEGELFTSENAIPADNLPLGADSLCVTLPGELYDSIRIDINGTFRLKDVLISTGEVTGTVMETTKPFDALRFVTCGILISLLPLLGMLGYDCFCRPKNKELLPPPGVAERRAKLYALAMLTVLIGVSAIVILLPYLLGERIYMFTDTGSDTQNVYYPFLMSLWQKLSTGDASLWDFTHGMGTNALTRQADVGSPFTWLTLVLGAGAVKFMLPYVHVLKILLSGYACFFYLDQFKFSNPVKTVVSCIFAFNGFSMLWGQHYFFATAPLWTVLMLFSVERALRCRKGLIWVAVTTLLIGLNSYYFAYMILILAGVYALFRLIAMHSHKQWRTVLGKIGMLGGAVLLGIGMSAVLFLPAANIILSTSTRVGGNQSIFETLALFGEKPIHSADVIDKLIARIFSNNVSGITTVNSTLNYYEAPQWFFTSFTIFFVCIFVTDIFFERAERIKVKLLKLCGLLLVLHLAIHPLLSVVLNGFVDRFYRYTFLIMPLLAFCFAHVLDKLIHGRLSHAKVQIAIAGSVFVLFFAIVLQNLQNAVYADIYEVDTALFVSLGKLYLAMGILLILLALVLQYKRLPRPAKSACALFGALVLLSNVAIDSYITANWRMSTSDTNPQVFATNGNDNVQEALDYLAQKDSSFYRTEKTFQDVAYLNDGMLEGYYGVSVYNSVVSGRFIDFVEQVCPEMQAQDADGYYDFRNVYGNPQLVSLLGVKYILSEQPINGIAQYVHIATFDDVLVYENTGTAGIGSFYTDTIGYEDFIALDDTAKQQLLSHKLILDTAQPATAAGANATVSFEKPQNSACVKGHVSTDAEGWLMVTIPFEDGWTAYADGVETEILCGDIAFSAIRVAAGEHEIEFRYQTPLLGAGIAISCISLAAFGVGCFVLWRSEKRKHTPAQA